MLWTEMSQTCKSHVGPTCKALGLPAAVPWLWQVWPQSSELQLWRRSNYGMKMQQLQPHGLREPLAKKMQYCIVALHLSFPTLVGSWKLCCGTKRCNQLLQFAGFAQGKHHDWTSNPKHTNATLISDTPETSDLDIELQKHQETPGS